MGIMGRGVLIIVCVLVAIGIVSAIIEGATKTPAQLKAEMAAERPGSARAACENFVRRHLDDPDSAEFIDRSTWPVIESSPRHFEVTATVRARNGFNALRLGRFHCTLEDRGDTWHADMIFQEP